MTRSPLHLLAAAALVLACGGNAATTTSGVTDADTPPALARAVDRVFPALERLSGLDRIEPLRVRTQSRADARAYVESRLDYEMPVDVREGLRRAYVAFGLIPDTLDLERLLLDLYTEQVLGYYDPAERTLYVIDDADPAALRPVLVHELVHALQDQHADLDSLVARERGNDRQTAAHAALEGHAMLTMFAYLAEEASRTEVDPGTLPSPAGDVGAALAQQTEEFPVLGRAPRIIQETLLFPYLAGAEFVHQLWSARAPAAQYPAPLDSLLPQSTEQVLHPRRAFIESRDEPVEVRFTEPAAGDVVYENTLGELETAILLEHHGGAAARAAAEGWAGDRYRLIATPDGDLLEWMTVWDSKAAAERFAAAFARAAPLSARTERIPYEGRPAVRVRLSGQ